MRLGQEQGKSKSLLPGLAGRMHCWGFNRRAARSEAVPMYLGRVRRWDGALLPADVLRLPGVCWRDRTWAFRVSVKRRQEPTVRVRKMVWLAD
jgi:hypothetical protein